MVICNKAVICYPESTFCGGSNPHEYQPEECGKCSYDPSARCVDENLHREETIKYLMSIGMSKKRSEQEYDEKMKRIELIA